MLRSVDHTKHLQHWKVQSGTRPTSTCAGSRPRWWSSTRNDWDCVGANQSTSAINVQSAKYVIIEQKGKNYYHTSLSLLVTYEPLLLPRPDLKIPQPRNIRAQFTGGGNWDETAEKPTNIPISSSPSPLFQRKENRDDLYVAHGSWRDSAGDVMN